MPESPTGTHELRCRGCGRQGSTHDEWEEVDHPPVGTLTQCPDCQSTDIAHIV